MAIKKKDPVISVPVHTFETLILAAELGLLYIEKVESVIPGKPNIVTQDVTKVRSAIVFARTWMAGR